MVYLDVPLPLGEGVYDDLLLKKHLGEGIRDYLRVRALIPGS